MYLNISTKYAAAHRAPTSRVLQFPNYRALMSSAVPGVGPRKRGYREISVSLGMRLQCERAPHGFRLIDDRRPGRRRGDFELRRVCSRSDRQLGSLTDLMSRHSASPGTLLFPSTITPTLKNSRPIGPMPLLEHRTRLANQRITRSLARGLARPRWPHTN